ncbi:MAG: hypothetical protein HKN73_05480, partial [Gemmatimonadetes bacterium]|nr:hypothetical protein [Gemmatimonadota bacterium]
VDSAWGQEATEGVYARPFIGRGDATAIGGYLEANTNYFVEDGISEGFSFEFRRFNLFFFSPISQRIQFLSELEFEHGTEEIALETALIDFRINPWVTFRGGIILPPLGYFNQNHDSPRWEFVDRPLVSTGIIPSTLSEVGGGVVGLVSLGGVRLNYDAYLTNGLGDGILDNDLGRTDISSGRSEEAFAEDSNGSPAFSARVAASNPLGRLGFSYYGGTYNRTSIEGDAVDVERRLDLFAVDVGASLGSVELVGEAALASIDVPSALTEVFGDRQWGFHVDAVWPIWSPPIAGYQNAVLNLSARVEHLDYNAGTFSSTGGNIGDHVTGVVGGLSFRPSPGTVFRFNYRRQWHRDFAGNPIIPGAGLQLGFATYF